MHAHHPYQLNQLIAFYGVYQKKTRSCDCMCICLPENWNAMTFTLYRLSFRSICARCVAYANIIDRFYFLSVYREINMFSSEKIRLNALETSWNVNGTFISKHIILFEYKIYLRADFTLHHRCCCCSWNWFNRKQFTFTSDDDQTIVEMNQ